MPSIIYVPAPHSPVRRMPKNVTMTTVEPSPWACVACKKRAITYADGTVWCNRCEKKLSDTEKVDVSRGRQRNTKPLEWTRVKT